MHICKKIETKNTYIVYTLQYALVYLQNIRKILHIIFPLEERIQEEKWAEDEKEEKSDERESKEFNIRKNGEYNGCVNREIQVSKK